MDKKETNRIFKVTTIFGGVQAVVVLGGLVKSKVAAVFLGPVGVGESSIYNNTVTLLVGLLGLGVGQSAIKFIAQAINPERKKILSRDTRLLSYSLAIIALLLTCLLSPFLSKVQFGDMSHVFGFCLMGAAICFTIVQQGTDSLLRSYKRTKSIAYSSLFNSILNVGVYTLFYVIWGEKVIAVVIMLGAFISMCISAYYSRDIGRLERININNRVLSRMYPIVTLGIMMVIASFMDSFVTNLVVYFIRIKESLNAVGMYQSALSISSMAIGMVYTAIANDYYPSLAESITSKEKQNNLINTQMNVNIHLLGPILLIMIVVADLLIRLFLAEEFLPISGFISWIFFACFCLSFSWCTLYLPLSYGHKKRYLLLTLVNCLIIAICQIPLFYYWGLKGIAIGYFLSKLLYSIVMYVVSYRTYSFQLAKKNIMDYILYSVLFLSLIFLKDEIHIHWGIQSLIALAGCTYSLYVISKSSDVISVVKSKLNRK